ncbi:MAG: hypothetical protein IKK57_01550 [Clostridia bacterium]|nr:hypothetical protein [Clostridia bacterium]
MSEQVKNAIDTGLGGLYVTEGDVAVILRRVRGAETARGAVRRRMAWRPALALAVVMLALVAAVTLRLTGVLPPEGSGVPDLHPLTQPDAASTEVPAGFVPVEREPVILVDEMQAIRLAEEYVHQQHDDTVDLRDGADYDIQCEYRAEDGGLRNLYRVHFRCLTLEGTDYVVSVSAEDGAILACEVTRGAQPGHTAWEIYRGFARICGSDRRGWTNAQLRDYCAMLKKAATGSLRWEDYLYLLSSYPDVAENAMTREEVIAAVEDDLDILLYEYDRQFSAMPRWTDAERIGGLRARYISAYPNPVWQVAADQRVVNQDGYETVRTVLIEVDSVTGVVGHVEAVDASCAAWYEGFTRATVDALTATTTSGDGHPGLTDEERNAIAAAYVAQRWGETRDISDPALFTLEEGPGNPAGMQVQLGLTYTSVGEGDVTQYVLWIDDYGVVQAANRSITPAGREPFTPTAPELDWTYDWLLECQLRAAASGDLFDPAMQVFLRTAWVDERSGGLYSNACQAVYDALGVRAATGLRGVMIDAEPHPVWKLAFESDRGEYLVEVDSVTNEVLNILQVEGLYQSWYLPFVLTADLEAAGVAIPEDAAPAYSAGVSHDTADGMRVDHLYIRFKAVYGPDMLQWTQEQLRAFQQMAVLSSDYDYDLGVICLRNTVYPDIPANAISREEAMTSAAAGIGLGGPEMWELCGAVLIGTPEDSAAHGTPVWKVCMRHTSGSFWYAEVNCMSGKLYRLHQDAAGAGSPGASYDYGTPQNLWFRDIVLEETIEDCESVWVCRGNG